jgi:hypothetical protein
LVTRGDKVILALLSEEFIDADGNSVPKLRLDPIG